MNDKLTPQHLGRRACVYVRQSSVHQVRHHHQGPSALASWVSSASK